MPDHGDFLEHFVPAFASALKEADSARPVARTARHTFQPGIGPFPEADAIELALEVLKRQNPLMYGPAAPRRYSGSRATCDLVIEGTAAIEFKLVRPFGDNGREAEHWSQNLLHPYPGNVSLLADCIKLLETPFHELSFVVAFGFEHSPPVIRLEPTFRSFEVIAEHVMELSLGPRFDAEVRDLVHPHHQQARVSGWQVLGRR